MAFRSEDHSDLSLFKNRLWILQNEKGYDTARKLAQALYDRKYITPNVKKKTADDNTPEKIHSNAIGTITSAVQRHMNSDTCEKLQGNYAIAYCKLFDCDFDFLYGNMRQTTHNYEYIEAETGLSENSVRMLHELYTPIFGERDSLQEKRYDIIGLNVILENLYDRFRQTEDYKKFSADTNSILHLIGLYLDSNSQKISGSGYAAINNLSILVDSELVRASVGKSIDIELERLRKEKSVAIPSMISAQKKHFQDRYDSDSQKYYAEHPDSET